MELNYINFNIKKNELIIMLSYSYQHTINNSQNQCPVCLKQTTQLIVFPCSHPICKSCFFILEYTTSCYYCRQPIEYQQIFSSIYPAYSNLLNFLYVFFTLLDFTYIIIFLYQSIEHVSFTILVYLKGLWFFLMIYYTKLYKKHPQLYPLLLSFVQTVTNILLFLVIYRYNYKIYNKTILLSVCVVFYMVYHTYFKLKS